MRRICSESAPKFRKVVLNRVLARRCLSTIRSAKPAPGPETILAVNQGSLKVFMTSAYRGLFDLSSYRGEQKP